MEEKTMNGLRVSIFDPTGNITALVETGVDAALQPAAAAEIMRRYPEVEQVGFVNLPEGTGRVRLRMAGGEFCGNASMSAAALYLLRCGDSGCADETKRVFLCVEGVGREVEVRLEKETDDVFRAAVRMPPVLSVSERVFPFGALRDPITVVRMEGIAHAIVTPASGFFSLRSDTAAAEEAARRLCAALGAEALGLMFLEGEAPRMRLTPLVYVPGSGTMIWENSCASGSAAVGTALAERSGARVSLELEEPGGVLGIESGGLRGETWLRGRTKQIKTESI